MEHERVASEDLERWGGAAMFASVLNQLSRTDAGIEFITASGVETVTYKELRCLIRANHEQFRRNGVRPNDCVAISVNTDLEHVVAFLALMSIGALPCSIKPPHGNPARYAKYVETVVRNFGIEFVYHSLPTPSRTRTLKATSLGASVCHSFPETPTDGDIAFVQFSSGSIGTPKPVPITNAALLSNLGAIISVDRRNASTVVLNAMPLSHDMGLVGGLLTNLVMENPLILCGIREFLFRPGKHLEYARRRLATVTSMPDFVMRYLTRALASRDRIGPVFERYQTIYCGSEPIRRETVREFLSMTRCQGLSDSSLCFSYGLAEATLLVTSHRFRDIDTSFDNSLTTRGIACVGKPVPGTDVSVVRVENGTGSIVVRGEGIFPGYWGEQYRVPNTWLDTGDLGYMLNGDLYVVGRSSDELCINGERLFMADIEAAIKESHVAEECVAVVENAEVHVIVVPSRTCDAGKIRHLLASDFGLTPRSVLIARPNQILRTTNRKVRRLATLHELRTS